MPGASGLSVVAIRMREILTTFAWPHIVIFTLQTYYLMDIVSGSITMHYFQEHKYVVL